MSIVIYTVHLVLAVLLVVVVLLQRGQGAEMGMSFGGGGSQTLFGSRGPATFLSKMTWIIAALFMTTSLLLALGSQEKATSVLESVPAAMQPVHQQKTAPANANDITIPPAEFDASSLKADDEPTQSSDGLPAADSTTTTAPTSATTEKDPDLPTAE
ncbi:MAG: preprotein translocase subunit SecG [Mariprofundales bacterium]